MFNCLLNSSNSVSAIVADRFKAQPLRLPDCENDFFKLFSSESSVEKEKLFQHFRYLQCSDEN